MNKFMRMLVFCDLPVVTAKEKKYAAKFRKFLLKDGYNMVQWSVYSRICNGMDAVAMHKQRLKQNLPIKGSVRALVLTEKQYENTLYLCKTTIDKNSYEAKATYIPIVGNRSSNSASGIHNIISSK